MTLRRQLMLLHIAFVVFAMAAALVTVYIIQVQLRDAGARFEQVVSGLHVIQQLQLDLQTLDVRFHEVVQHARPADEEFKRTLQSVHTRLAQVRQQIEADEPAEIQALARQLETVISNLNHGVARCLELVETGEGVAIDVYRAEVEPWLLQGAVTLRELRRSGEAAQSASTQILADYDTTILVATILVALVGVVLVLLGIWLVRERLLLPLEQLQTATAAFARGELDHRVNVASKDELGALGEAMNRMAGALDGSQRKYQNLFQNLRDTVIVCDAEARVIECHEGDADLLGFKPNEILTRLAPSVWPNWRFGSLSWRELIARVIDRGQLLRISDVQLDLDGGHQTCADVVAYPAHAPTTLRVAIALRDVSERARLEQAARRGEAMEASVTLARGVAHDFKNLLQNAVGALGELQDSSGDPPTAERVRAALIACEQAARLSKRLSRLAADDPGHPEVLDLSEIAHTILDSLDAELLRQVDIKRDLGAGLLVFADRDQLTRVLLNLVYNACEAMPNGGTLRIVGSRQETANPMTPARSGLFVVLDVSDTGIGMAAEVRERVFEPMFSTKPRGDDGPRGLGLAVVYAAVNQAGGFLQVDSTPGVGTTFQIFLPAHDAPRLADEPADR